MSESARNPRAQAKKRGELPARTREETSKHYYQQDINGYLKYLASQITCAEHFQKIMSDVSPKMAFQVKRQIMKHLPRHVVQELLDEKARRLTPKPDIVLTDVGGVHES